MSTSTKVYKVNSPQVIFEEINGDIIAIHFDSGSYYNLNGTAGWIWQSLSLQATSTEMIDFLQSTDPANSNVSPEVSIFISELLQEGLIVETEPEARTTLLPPLIQTSYSRPVLNRFDDMQQLLLVDPIHEVGASGWPEPKSVQ
jgi:hypothetical protein